MSNIKEELIRLIEDNFNYMYHDTLCDYHTSEFCTCGMARSKNNIKKFVTEKIE